MCGTWSKDELQRIAETDDLHIAVPRGWDDLRHTDMDFGQLWSMADCTCGHITVEWALVSGCNSAEDGPDYCSRHDDGSWFRARRWFYQRQSRRRISFEYASSPYLKPMVSARARAATVQ
jgi:hypothetical protein